ncbi:hypothetical protein INH39_10095 [Massilia violaceinigra]|uniref:Uncharacterized protein n=1 Tax=Massilia violaceinigra TaxID=2045208 RepID=A0ABY4AAZ6_9BURK|nr:hypothetical protein [Massilia violaceinigra]UOD31983.1 hypothetical protein INH39_10095 [Massilia violaceinigra]
MRPAVLFPSVLFAVLLASCSEHKAATPPAAAAPPASASAGRDAAPPPAPPTPAQRAAGAALLQERLVLMRAIFGQAYRPETSQATIEAGEPGRPGTRQYALVPIAHTFLPDGDAVLVGVGGQTDEQGHATDFLLDAGLLNVFILRKVDGAWTELRHHANVSALAHQPGMNKAVFVNLAPGKPGLAMLAGFNSQGEERTLLSLFDLGAETLRDLAGEPIHIASGNRAGCNPSGPASCFNIAGGWHFAAPAGAGPYNDLVLTLKGEQDIKQRRKTPGPDGDEYETAATRKLGGTARYAWNGSVYALAEGANKEPQP